MPIYDYLASLDLDLFVMGKRPDDVLARKAGARWIQQDYSQASTVKEWMRENHCGIIVPGCTDVSLNVAAEVGISPFIDSEEAISTFNDKTKFRIMCRKLGLPAPEVAEPSIFPVRGTFIAKPVDSFSGRGITVFDGTRAGEVDAALTAAKGASPTNSALIEEYIEGQLYSYSVFIKNRQATAGFFVKEGSSANRFAVDTSFVVRDMSENLVGNFNRLVANIANLLLLKDGLLHIQFILRGNKPFLIEATRRCPGDLYASLIEFSTGYPYAAHYASAFIGEQFSAVEQTPRFVVRHTVTSLSETINTGIQFSTSASVRAFIPLQRVGESLLPEQKARSGVLFLESQSMQEAGDTYESFLNRSVYID